MGPTGNVQAATAGQTATAVEQILTSLEFSSNVKVFAGQRATLANIVSEMQDGERIILLLRSTEDATIGHAVFVWSANDMNNQLEIIDPNVHPNTEEVDANGNPLTPGTTNPNTNEFVPSGAAPTTGSATTVTVRMNGVLSPYTTPAVEYGRLVNNAWDITTYDMATFNYRIESFVSVSDVEAIPEPGSVVIWSALGGLGWIVARRQRKRRRVSDDVSRHTTLSA